MDVKTQAVNSVICMRPSVFWSAAFMSLSALPPSMPSSQLADVEKAVFVQITMKKQVAYLELYLPSVSCGQARAVRLGRALGRGRLGRLVRCHVFRRTADPRF
eukprot:TRINITY_DN18507_c0_g1_i2.p2 TRINITY_DN18507_c0_g1~~TRINITY_DN18507_c0_g1_i2.p2  ORF type:complete len:103 (+),score=4.58 TRINITY_DN18507_c0_g1_i2:87-395(+)